MNHCNGGRVSLAAGPHVRERKILGLESFSVQRCQISAESLETSSTINREHHQICGARPYDFFFFFHGIIMIMVCCIKLATDSSQSFSREKGSFFSHNVKSVLPFALLAAMTGRCSRTNTPHTEPDRRDVEMSARSR